MILKRYLFKEILQNFLAVFLVLMLIVFSLRFVRYLGDVAAGKMTAEVIYQMLILRMITSMKVIIPLCLYLSLFMALGRMQKDNELVSIANAGLGQRFYFTSLLKLAGIFALLLFLLTMFVMPWAESNIDLLKQKANRESDITGISAGSFKEFSKGNRVLYVEDFSKNSKTMKNVFLQVLEQGSVGVLTSDSARIITDEKSGERSVIFLEGKRYVGKPGQLDYSITEYRRYSVRLEQQGYNTNSQSLARIPGQELWRSSEPSSRTELQWRLATPVAVLILSAFAILVVRSFSDIRGSLVLITAILIYFIYNNLLNIVHDLVLREKLDSFPGLWWPHLMMLAVILSFTFLPKLRRKSDSVS